MSNPFLQPAPTCPNCSSPHVVRMLWGMPDFSNADLNVALQQERVHLAGCIVFEERPPRWLCRNCGRRWGNAFVDPDTEMTHGPYQ